MGYALRSALLTVSLLAFSACGISSPEDLAEETLGYLVRSDFTGYFEDTVVTPSQVLEICPAIRNFSIDKGKFQERFARCLSKADFATAELVATTPKKGFASTAECGGSEPVETADDIDVTVKTSTRVYTFKIRGALATHDGWRVANTLDCD
ncbi:MAG: hypothetical protein ACK4N5_00905 [Myxococcales bacterium]